ncbi:MAG: GFA family protein [Myxococcota bacterium]
MPSGGCLCGAVRFEVTGPLSEIELCHCVRCRKAYGADFAATLYARRGDFHWRAGEDAVTTFDAPLRHRPPAYRHCFCATCGSPAPLSWPDLPFVEIPAGLFDAGDDDPQGRPAYHQFVTQKAPWHEIADALPRHDAGAPLDRKVLGSILR